LENQNIILEKAILKYKKYIKKIRKKIQEKGLQNLEKCYGNTNLEIYSRIPNPECILIHTLLLFKN